jgi:mono/diheme cytochrome c family protein
MEMIARLEGHNRRTIMIANLRTIACVALPLVVLSVGVAHHGQAKHKASKAVPFAKVAPLFKSQCESCHNAARHAGDVDLSSYKAVLKGGEHGAIVVAGHPETSKLISYVDGSKQPRMPFGKPPLSKAQIDILKKWVATGAKG